MLRPPLISPLFPYTTLFRSRLGEIAADVNVRANHGNRADSVVQIIRDPYPVCAAPFGHMRKGVVVVASVIEKVAAGIKDRKSTRLNSSHLGISYAVFCLKKK